jgi:hypothetical protein
MGERDFQLVVLAAASACLCAVAVMYGQRLATVIFAALTSGTLVIAAALRRRS